MTTVQSSATMSAELMAAMNPGRKTAASTTDDAQNKFLTLLVTQMRNQDPLNPMDNAQVTSQLAQLSTVTGIEKMNETLLGLQGSYQSSQTLQAVGMIGHGVFAPGDSMVLEDGKALFGLDMSGPADSVKVTIRDANGNAVKVIDVGRLESGSHPLHWDGTTTSGEVAENGVYSIEVAATRAGEKVAAETLSFGEVASVTTGAQGVKLTVMGVGDIGLEDVRQII